MRENFQSAARQAPDRLALVTPDGRHWSRGELLVETSRPHLAAAPAGTDYSHLIDSLARHLTARPGLDGDASVPVELTGLGEGMEQVMYCAAPLSDTRVFAAVVAAMGLGHTVIVSGDENAENSLASIARYRASYCCVTASQWMALCAAPSFDEQWHGLRRVILSGPVEDEFAARVCPSEIEVVNLSD